MRTFMFSTEEINLMCIFNTDSREGLLSELLESLPDVYEPEMREIYDSVIEKLETLTADEFTEIGFYYADEYYEGEE